MVCLWTSYLLRNRYARYVERLCKHGMYKNYEEYCYLVLEKEVCFIMLVLLWGFSFFGNWCFVCFLPFIYLGTMILVVTILSTVEALYFWNILLLIWLPPWTKLPFVPEILESCCEGLIIVFLLRFLFCTNPWLLLCTTSPKLFKCRILLPCDHACDKCIPCLGKTVEYYIYQFLLSNDLFNIL